MNGHLYFLTEKVVLDNGGDNGVEDVGEYGGEDSGEYGGEDGGDEGVRVGADSSTLASGRVCEDAAHIGNHHTCSRRQNQ